MKKITVLIPTYNRSEALATTLTSLCFQTYKGFDVVISDQSEEPLSKNGTPLQTIINILETKGHNIRILRNLPRRGMAHQRQFLLNFSNTLYSLFLDDDLVLEPYVIANMKKAIEEEECGFVGSAAIGLSFLHDIRFHEQHIEFWESKVVPETITPNAFEWKRHLINNAANIFHIQQKYNITPQEIKKYKIAWIGACTLYDTEKLKAAGGFNFWREIPEKHCGEDVMAQLRVMKKYGGCGVLPSGVYHQELQTTIPDRKINIPEYMKI